MGRTDEASIEVAADATRSYAALTDPVARESWIPPEGMTGHVESYDLRVGGGYRMTLTYVDAADHQIGLRSSLQQLAAYVS